MRPKHVGILLLLLLKHFRGTPMALNASDIFIRNKQRSGYIIILCNIKIYNNKMCDGVGGIKYKNYIKPSPVARLKNYYVLIWPEDQGGGGEGEAENMLISARSVL